MKKYQLFVGLEDQKEKRQIIDTQAALDFIASTLVDAGIEGCTFTTGKGLYLYKDGSIGYETSIIAMILDFDGNALQAIHKAVPTIKQRLNQESVALEYQEVESMLI